MIELAKSLRDEELKQAAEYFGSMKWTPWIRVVETDLVTTGGARIVGNEFIRGKATPCITCHGPDLMGVGEIPPIVGRSPSYMVLQMWDMQQGSRNSEAAQLMKIVMANLTPEDMIAIAAYLSSRPPVAATAPTKPTS